MSCAASATDSLHPMDELLVWSRRFFAVLVLLLLFVWKSWLFGVFSSCVCVLLLLLLLLFCVFVFVCFVCCCFVLFCFFVFVLFLNRAGLVTRYC